MKKVVSALLVSILILLNCVVSNAANGPIVLSLTGATNVDVGSEVTVYLKIDALNGVDRATALSGKLEYDTEAFQLISVTGENSWAVTSGNKILATHSSATSGNVLKIVLKALKKPASGTTVLKFTNVETSDNNDEFVQDSVSSSAITINDNTPSTPETPDEPSTPETPETPDEPSTPETPDEPSTPETPDVPSTPETPSTPSTNNDDNTTAKVKLPATGLDITVVTLAVLAIVIGIVSLVRYKKVKLK